MTTKKRTPTKRKKLNFHKIMARADVLYVRADAVRRMRGVTIEQKDGIKSLQVVSLCKAMCEAINGERP